MEPSNLCRKASIGITAGASTPEWIIKEVYDKMSDENIEIEESFAEMLEKSIKTLNTGEKVTGLSLALRLLRSMWISAPSTPVTYRCPN